jgi:hypothetical protein
MSGGLREVAVLVAASINPTAEPNTEGVGEVSRVSAFVPKSLESRCWRVPHILVSRVVALVATRSFFRFVSSWCNILVLFFATNKPIMDNPIQLGLNATSYTPPYTPPSSVQSEEHPYNGLSPPQLSTVDFVLTIRLVVL